AHDLARRALPAMRRQGHGRIVNVASVAGHVPVPLLGAYCATKFALRALTQAMDMETRGFGVRAVLVEPGPIATRFGDRSMAEQRTTLTDAGAGPYASMYRRWAQRRGQGWGGASADRVARKVVHACMAAGPRNHYFVPWTASWSNLGRRLLPDAWIMAGMRAYFR
ncbi:MAG: SDR family NAD(P)-dependent oxidoreductase, partial [Thermoplasmatota archaeon]